VPSCDHGIHTLYVKRRRHRAHCGSPGPTYQWDAAAKPTETGCRGHSCLSGAGRRGSRDRAMWSRLEPSRWRRGDGPRNRLVSGVRPTPRPTRPSRMTGLEPGVSRKKRDRPSRQIRGMAWRLPIASEPPPGSPRRIRFREAAARRQHTARRSRNSRDTRVVRPEAKIDSTASRR
jgi:hypothetical protein